MREFVHIYVLSIRLDLDTINSAQLELRSRSKRQIPGKILEIHVYTHVFRPIGLISMKLENPHQIKRQCL